jgi:uncharacterized membrane protein YphA (DoxX/SURF4 family)
MESCGPFCFSPLLIGKLAGAVFFAILFLQSGFDKLNDWKGNHAWINKYFETSPLKRFTFALLVILTMVEVAAGFFSVAGIITTFTCRCSTYLTFAALFSGVSLIFLFFGMRMAKDYVAAASLAGYFAVWIGWLILMSF